MDITERDLTIAIPLNKKTYSGKLFAYLPVKKDTGIPALINADFLLASSRESILECSWNAWLWEEIPTFFAEIVEYVMCNDAFSIDVKCNIFNKIPTNAIETQYKNLVDEILCKLQNKKCLLSYESYKAVFPNECRKVFQSAKDLLKKLDWHPDSENPFFLLANELDEYSDVLEKLGIVQINNSEVLKLISDNFITGLTDEKFVELYLFLSKAHITQIRNLSWVPVVNAENIRSMAGGGCETIYYPIEIDSQNEQIHSILEKKYTAIP